MMDFTPLEHLAITVSLVFIGWLCFGSAGAMCGAAFGIGVFCGREECQNEYRHIAAIGGRRADMPFMGGFYTRFMDTGSYLDFIVPTLGGIGVAYCLICWF